MYQATLDTYINICPQRSSYIFKPTSKFPSYFVTNISYPFHISLNHQFPTQFSRHILSNVFDLSFHIAAVSKSPMLCFVCRVPFEFFIHVSNYKH